MDPPFSLPISELFASEVRLDGDTLHIRLVGDFHPEADPPAFRIAIRSATDVGEAYAYLRTRLTNEDCVYVWSRNGGMYFESEEGDALTLLAGSFEGGPAEFNEKELKAVVARVYAWYKAEHLALRAADLNVQAARTLLFEQARRVRVKAASHDADSPAGVLYSQHLQFIDRLLRETET